MFNQQPQRTGRAKRRQHGFTLTELLIVVAIIGVLSAIAVPKYQDYVGRAQAAEAFTATAGLRSELAIYHAENGGFAGVKDDTSIQGAANVEGRYIGSVAIADANDGSYTVKFGYGVHANDSLTIAPTVTDEDQISRWTCSGTASDGVEDKYLPAACRDDD